jgi:hypothetical protein
MRHNNKSFVRAVFDFGLAYLSGICLDSNPPSTFTVDSAVFTAIVHVLCCRTDSCRKVLKNIFSLLLYE